MQTNGPGEIELAVQLAGDADNDRRTHRDRGYPPGCGHRAIVGCFAMPLRLCAGPAHVSVPAIGRRSAGVAHSSPVLSPLGPRAQPRPSPCADQPGADKDGHHSALGSIQPEIGGLMILGGLLTNSERLTNSARLTISGLLKVTGLLTIRGQLNRC
jgi:hypothetical protein